MAGKLTPKQARFVDEYLVDLNGKQAAIRAGYSERSAEVQASRLLSKAKVAEAVSARQTKRSAKTEVTQERVIMELARIAFADMARYVEWGQNGVTLVPKEDLTEEETRAILEVSESVSESNGDTSNSSGHSRKIKLYDKIRALELLGKHMGLPDKHELTGKDGGPVRTEGGLSDEAAETLRRKILGLK